ncbi:MAG: hypothetical protein KBG80_07665 [Breznakibacter sp.]|nr:hypothetical protein [Breznakibacter sp.]
MKIFSPTFKLSVTTKFLTTLLLLLTLDFTYYVSDGINIATTIECEAENSKEFFEDISNEDANIEKPLLISNYTIKYILPISSFLLVYELTNQVWQPPKTK